jgi:hypothetical protein
MKSGAILSIQCGTLEIKTKDLEKLLFILVKKNMQCLLNLPKPHGGVLIIQ